MPCSEVAAVVVDVELLGTDEGGRRSPVVGGYRPQLDLGPCFASGDRSQWDSQWRFRGELAPRGARAPALTDGCAECTVAVVSTTP